MVEELQQERSTRIESNRYESHLTLGRTALRMSAINPLIDSYAINSYGKVNHATAKFKNAMKTGSYNNYSFGGGNIFGEKIGKKLFGGKSNMERASDIHGTRSFNFVSKNGAGAGLGMADEAAENVVRTGVGFSRNETGLFKMFSEISETKKYTPRVKSISGNKNQRISVKEIKTSLSKMIDSGAGKDEILETIGKSASNSADDLIKYQKAAWNAGVKINVNTASQLADKDVFAKATKELVDGIDNKFFKATTMEKVFGSKASMWITSAGNLSGKAGMGLQLGAAVLSSVSMVHQESAVQSGVVQTNFNLIKGEESTSSNALEASQSNNSRSRQTDEELNHIIKSSNNAESFRRDAGAINIDRTKSSMKNFTLY